MRWALCRGNAESERAEGLKINCSWFECTHGGRRRLSPFTRMVPGEVTSEQNRLPSRLGYSHQGTRTFLGAVSGAPMADKLGSESPPPTAPSSRW